MGIRHYTKPVTLMHCTRCCRYLWTKEIKLPKWLYQELLQAYSIFYWKMKKETQIYQKIKLTCAKRFLGSNFNWAVIDKISFFKNSLPQTGHTHITCNFHTIFEKRQTNPFCPINFVEGTHLVFKKTYFQFLPVAELFNPNLTGLVGKVRRNYLPKEEGRVEKNSVCRAPTGPRARTRDLLRARRGSPAARHGSCLDKQAFPCL